MGRYAPVYASTTVFADNTMVIIAAFSGIRAFALCRSWALSILIFVLSLVPLGVNFVRQPAQPASLTMLQSVKIYGVNDTTLGCGMGESIDLATSLKYVPHIIRRHDY